MGGSPAGWVGLKLWTLPACNFDGFPGWAPATPSFFAHRSLVWLFAGVPFHSVIVHAPCQNLFVVVGYLLDPLNRPKGNT